MRLNIPKGQSEFVNRRRTDNTLAKRKRTGFEKLATQGTKTQYEDRQCKHTTQYVLDTTISKTKPE